jgi:hypothetical protein
MQSAIMNQSTQRWIIRSIHLILAIPIIGYIYSPFDRLPDYAPATRFVFVPAVVLSGLWMWKGHVVRQFFSKRSAQHVVSSKRAMP